MNARILGFLSAFALTFLGTVTYVSAQHPVPPTRVSGSYNMTTWNPVPIGTCSGEGAGCTTVYGMDYLSDGRMVLLTSDYIGHGPMPDFRPRSKISLISTPISSTSTVTTIASHFRQPTGVLVVNDTIWVGDMDSVYIVTNLNPTPADTNKNKSGRFRTPNATDNNGNTTMNFKFPSASATNCGGTCTTLNSKWHHYVFTPVQYQGKFYAAYGGSTLQGNGTANLDASSYFASALLTWDRTTATLDTTANRFAGGLRSPNGTALGPNGSIFVTDHQGSYLPMSTLTRYKVGASKMQYGGYRQDPSYVPNWGQVWYDRGQADYVPPVAINRYDQSGKTGWVGIAQPFWLTQGAYAGQIIVGDINSRGLWRVALDTLNDTTGTENVQGAVFYFNPGSSGTTLGTGNAGINRLSQGPDGTIYAGAGRGVGNWAGGASANLIYVFKPKPNATQFEIMSIRSLKDGYELVLNKKVNPATVSADRFAVKQRSWVRQSAYGFGFAPANSPNSTTGAAQFTNRTIDSVQVSLDSMRIRLKVAGVLRINQSKRGDTVTHWHTLLTFASTIRSSTGDTIYTTEADYAQNWINTTRSWNGGVLPPVSVDKSKTATMLQNKVWITRDAGALHVNVDNMKPYEARLRDITGRTLSRVSGNAGMASVLSIPAGTQGVYTLEVKSAGETYSKIISF